MGRFVWTLALGAMLSTSSACGSNPPPAEPPATPPPVATPATPIVEASPSPAASPTPSAAALVRQGAKLASDRQYKEALAVLEQAEALDPEDPELHLQLYLCHRALEPESGPRSQAAIHAKRYLELAPNAPPARQVERFLAGVEATGKVGGLLGTKAQGRLKDLPGWGGVKWGMGSDQVEKALGGVLKPFTGQYSNPGHVVPYCIPSLTAQGIEWSALFPFDNDTGEISGIYLRPANYPSGTREDFDRLEKWLTTRLGTPTSDDLENPMATRLRRVWNLKTTTVKLNLYNGGDLSLLFRPAEGQGAGD